MVRVTSPSTKKPVVSDQTSRTAGETAAGGRYGFVSAFNPLKNWYDSDVVGIDTGITMIMAEKFAHWFRLEYGEAQKGLERAGFRPASSG